MATASSDENGYIEIKGNKLSKPGVFPYMGYEINAPVPDKVYYVFRPPEELRDIECINSFKLMPWVIGHKMLGKKYNSPAEQKGIHGTIGEEVYFDETDQWLKGNIKIWSDTLETEITLNKDELSLGFGCKYDFNQTGEYEGQRYDVVQRRIRGNHLASVEDSRMDVAVMDHATATAMDHMTVTLNYEGNTMVDKTKKDEQNKPEDKAGTGQDQDMTMKEMMGMMKEIMPMMMQMKEMMAMMSGQGMEAKDNYAGMDGKNNDKDGKDGKDGKGKDEDKDDKKDGEGMDQQSNLDLAAIQKQITQAVNSAVQPLATKVDGVIEKQTAMDSGGFLKEISERDALVAKLTPFIGAFDHQSMTRKQVAEYGVKELKVPCEAGSEVAALTAYLHNRPSTPALFAVNTGQDAASVGEADALIDKHINGQAK